MAPVLPFVYCCLTSDHYLCGMSCVTQIRTLRAQFQCFTEFAQACLQSFYGLKHTPQSPDVRGCWDFSKVGPMEEGLPWPLPLPALVLCSPNALVILCALA